MKVDGVHLKKLDDRSRALVHLGTEPGSKAYRLLDPTTRRIVVSRDVVFDENQGWKWNKSEREASTETGIIDFDFREVEDQGPQEESHDETFGGDETGAGAKDEERGETETDNSPAVLRRSSRISKLPSYLEDYELLCEEDEEYETLCEIEVENLLLLVNEEPWSFEEAMELKV